MYLFYSENGAGGDDQDKPAHEILQEQALRHVLREYLEFLGSTFCRALFC